MVAESVEDLWWLVGGLSVVRGFVIHPLDVTCNEASILVDLGLVLSFLELKRVLQ